MNPVDFLEEVGKCANKLKNQAENIEKAISILYNAKQNGKQVFLCGNGGSAGTATHMAGDLFKIARIKAISLNDNIPLITAYINDDGWGTVYEEQLKRLFNKGDVLIAISVHGGSGEENAGPWSQNLNRAIDYVIENEGMTIGFSGFEGGSMKKNCNVCIVVPAETTPLVEAFHVVLHHLITFALQEGNRI